MKLRKIFFEKSDVTCVRQAMKKCQRYSQLHLLETIHKEEASLLAISFAGASGSKSFSISAMIDSIFQPLFPRLPTYCSNSNHVIYQLNQTLKKLHPATNNTERHHLVTVDVVSMHTNMLKEEIKTNFRKLLNEKFMHVSEPFPIEEML